MVKQFIKKYFTKKNIIIATAVVVALIITFVVAFTHRSNKNDDKIDYSSATIASNSPIAINNSDTDNDTEKAIKYLSDKSVVFPGINRIEASKGSTVELSNPAENKDFLMQYVIIDSKSGKTLYTSDYIKAGSSILWTPANSIKEKGMYKIEIEEHPYYPYASNKLMPLTSGCNETTILLR